jgi:hypothetical protein
MHMSELLTTLQDVFFDWLMRGLSGSSGWQIVAYTLATTHIAIAAVTLFLLAFGAIGATVWAVQMLWIPVSAAGGGCDHAQHDHREPP